MHLWQSICLLIFSSQKQVKSKANVKVEGPVGNYVNTQQKPFCVKHFNARRRRGVHAAQHKCNSTPDSRRWDIFFRFPDPRLWIVIAITLVELLWFADNFSNISSAEVVHRKTIAKVVTVIVDIFSVNLPNFSSFPQLSGAIEM